MPEGADRRPARRPWRKKLLFAGAAAALVAVTGLGLLELGFRLFWNPPQLAELQQAGMYCNAGPGHVALTPGYRGWLQIGDSGRRTRVEINSLGLRGPEIGPRQPGELRVLCAGDSLVFGYGVEAEEAFPALLQERLRAGLGRPVVAGNAGVPGYGVRQQVEHVRRLLPLFEPDALVCCIYPGNDFVDDQKPEHYVEAGLMFEGAWARLFRRSLRAKIALRSRFWMFCELQIMQRFPGIALQPLPSAAELDAFRGFPNRIPPRDQTHAGLFLDVIDPQRSWSPEDPVPVVPRVLQGLAESLQRLRELAGTRPVQLLLLPTRWHVDQGLWAEQLERLGLDPAEYRFGLLRQRIARVAAEVGLPLQDVTELFLAQQDPASLFIEDGGHFTPEGHRIVADWLTERLAALLR